METDMKQPQKQGRGLSSQDNPIDIIEKLADDEGWPTDRMSDDQISLAIKGAYQLYTVTILDNQEEGGLRFITSMDHSPLTGTEVKLYELLNCINDIIWVGTFTFWAEEKLLIWRAAHVYTPDHLPTSEVLESIITEGADRFDAFYYAFKQVACGETNLDRVLSEVGQVVGRA
jgi:hypothetical protein